MQHTVGIPMAVRRDYGSFVNKLSLAIPASRTAWLSSMVRRRIRARKSWLGRGFLPPAVAMGQWALLRQPWYSRSRPLELWALEREERNFGLLFAWRLSDAATEDGGERWYTAKNKEQLQNNINIVVSTLAKVDSWFQQFRSFSDWSSSIVCDLACRRLQRATCTVSSSSTTALTVSRRHQSRSNQMASICW
jgi:hypothetical protein